MKRSLLGTGILSFALLMTGSAFADHGHGHDRDHDGWRNHEGGHVRSVADHDRRPPGWDHGQKRGWGDHHMPPGQAKKHEAWERHEARERHEHAAREAREHRAQEWRQHREAREQRAAEWRQRHQAREQRMQDWRAREQKERERREAWRRSHPNAWPHRPTTPTATSPATPSAPVATTRPPVTNAPIILPSGRRLPTQPTN